MTLDNALIGKPYRIVAVDCRGALRRRLLDMGLTPKTTVSIRKVAPMGDPMELTVRGYELTVRKEDAAKIQVEPMGDPGVMGERHRFYSGKGGR